MKKSQGKLLFRVMGVIIAITLLVSITALIRALAEPVEKKQSVPVEATSEQTVQKSTTSMSTTADSTIPPKAKLSLDEQWQQKAQERLASMSLEEKVGQLFLARVPATNALGDIERYHLGGYLLFGRDVEGETAVSLKDKIAGFQSASQIPMLIASDEEGGTVSRLSRQNGLLEKKFESPQSIYQSGGWPAIREDTIQKARILKSFGINVGMFPIADVATDEQAFIYNRTIGLDAGGTARYVEETVRVLAKEKSGSTLKHFPGYGNNRDSHTEIVRDTRTLAELTQNDFIPFKVGIKNGADSILVSHNVVQAIDADLPASISTAVHRVLREDMNFHGVIMTDDMDMAGLAQFVNQAEASVLAIKAGNDLILSSSYQSQIPAVLQAIQQGELSEEQINQAVIRILKWKYKLTIIE